MIVFSVFMLMGVSCVMASSSCISLPAIKEYETAREPLQNIDKFLKKCHGSYSTKEPIVTMRRYIRKLEKQFAAVNKIFYERKWSDEQKHNGHCYIFSKDKLPWEKAKKRCQEINGYLLKIDNEKENTWVNERARKKGGSYYWTGLSSKDKYTWRWAHEKNNMEYAKFKKGYPVKYGRSPRCVYFYSHDYGYWMNTNCKDKKNYICETDKCV